MNRLQAYYKFRLIPLSGSNYKLEKIYKVGNAPYINDLFLYDKPITFKKLHPPGLIEDYIVYPVEYGRHADDKHVLMFETASFLYPYGNVNVINSNDCILFRLSEENTFEVFISKYNSNNVAQLLMMLIDGSLTEDINQLISQIPDYEN